MLLSRHKLLVNLHGNVRLVHLQLRKQRGKRHAIGNLTSVAINTNEHAIKG